MGDLARAVPDVAVWGRLTLVQLRRVGVDSLPVALFIAAFTGVVLALQASYTFRNTVPLYFVGTLVGKTMMLELGPVLAGLALAGRVGASMAAELGTMRVTEQVDALETLAYDPQSFLVLPRVLAGTAMFPIIVALAIVKGILTGWIASLALLDLTTPEFIKGLKLFYRFKDTWFGLFKSATFGFTITLVGCVVGLGTRGGAEGVGLSTTRAVSPLERDALMALRRDIGFVFQFGALFDSMTVFDNVALGLRRRDLSDDEIAERVREALAVVDLTGAEETYPAELSGGMRKRVGIARAIALRPRYLLYDEPTTGLDPVTSAVIDQLMVRTREHLGVTGIVVTHDMRSAYTVGDRIAMLYEGRIRQVGTVAQIKQTEDPVVRQFIEGRPA